MKHTTLKMKKKNPVLPTHQCNRPEVNEDDYFCDKELMQLLVFDAKVTEFSYKSAEYEAKNRREEELVERYGASLRFVSTQSGLTRWQTISEPTDDDERPFGDENNRALDEVWYRSAVLHHHLDPEAFVFSIPFEDKGSHENSTVIATHAIFPRDGGNEAPGCVVGLHIQHSALYNRFMEITRNPYCRDCLACSSDELDCYVIDGNGYIVISEVLNDTGRFFGEVEGAIFEAMISKNIFRHVVMFDYQATCYFPNTTSSGVDVLWTPFKLVYCLGKWVFANILWTLITSQPFFNVQGYEDYDEYIDFSYVKEEIVQDLPKKTVFPTKDKKPKIRREPCDKMGSFYLQHLSKEGYQSTDFVNCTRPFYVKRIPHTNLLLVVVNILHQSCYSNVQSEMNRIEYNSSEKLPYCQKLYLNTLPRKKLAGCFNYHPMEEKIEDCGGSRSSGSLPSMDLFYKTLLLFMAIRNTLISH